MDDLLVEQDKITENIKCYTSGLKSLPNDKNKLLYMDDTKGSRKTPSTSNDPLEVIDSNSDEVNSLEGFDLSLVTVISERQGIE